MAFMNLFLLLVLPLSLILNTTNAQPRNNSTMIRPGSSLSPNNNSQYWVSESGQFAFGFYPNGNGFSVGIWFAKLSQKTLVWTANRDDPPFQSDAKLFLSTEGRLIVQIKQGQEVSIANAPQFAASASMLDSGNFVLYNSSSGIIWQSFDFPTDTILPGQRLVPLSKLVSSVSETNHASGTFMIIMQSDGNLVQYPVNAVRKEKEYAYWNTQTQGPGNGVTLNLDSNGLLYLLNATKFNIKTISGSVSVSAAGNPIYRATIDVDGIFRLYSFRFNQSTDWSIAWASSANKCDPIGLCGVNSYCTLMDEDPVCQCLPGFDFIDKTQKDSGCHRSYGVDACTGKNNGLTSNFSELVSLLWGEDDAYASFSPMTKDDCTQECSKDCNCEAAFYENQSCKKLTMPLRFGRRELSRPAITFVKIIGVDHVGAVPPPTPKVGETKQRKLRLDIIIISIALAFLVVISLGVIIYRHRLGGKKHISPLESNGFAEDVTLRSFTYEELRIASNDFTQEIGRGSCGAVFKGAMSNGTRNVAIKRLEKVLTEGQREFKNEMKIIGKTHHKNLVKLLGYCHEDGNMLLVYEYMSHGSLADFFFKARLKTDWEGRIEIALDIARGILYLHEECETQIIHCDIKPENILMDDNGCAKIADFGLAKLLMANQTKTYTGIRGTRGYVAPEWWHQNSFITSKVDVFSFGIVLLEIICRRRSIDMNAAEDEAILAYFVYDCFMARELEKLVKGTEEVEMEMLERIVKVGLWCIQDDPKLRPSMKKVVQMLEGTIDILVPSCRPSSFASSSY